MRLNLESIRDHLAASVVLSGETIRFGTAYERDYMTAYAQTFPAIWVAGQKIVSVAGRQSYSGLHHQKMKSTVPVRIVLQRYEDGQDSIETVMDSVFGQVYDCLFGWTPEGAESPMSFERTEDGPADTSILIADMFFTADIRLRKLT